MTARAAFLLGGLASLSVLTGCSSGDSGAVGADPDKNAHRVTLTAAVPDGTPTVYLTGSLDALGPWNPAALPLQGTGRQRTATVRVPHGATFEYKFTLGSWDREGLGPSGTVMPNFRLVARSDTAVTHEIVDFKKDARDYIADWRGSGVKGTLAYWTDVRSSFLSEPRHVEVWLPPGYEANAARRYRVLYMHDGQNLFDPRIANTGTDWGVDEAMTAGAEAGRFEPAIVVGVWNSSRRLLEYSPWHEAPSYARFLIEELMPRVDAEFRTLTGPENTFVMGSSMGGLLSYFLVKERPDRFSACGCVSTHFPLSAEAVASVTGAGGGSAKPYILRDIEAGATVPQGVRFSFDYGTEGLDAAYGPTHDAVRSWLLSEGLIEGRDFVVRRYQGATHNEASWRARLVDQLTWMLAPRR
jgi:enterochelin esterase-like enzyme